MELKPLIHRSHICHCKRELAQSLEQAYNKVAAIEPIGLLPQAAMQSQEMEMKRVIRTVARLLMRMSRHRAELFMKRQAAGGCH